MRKLECQVCRKMFKTDVTVTTPINEEFELMHVDIEDMVCNNPECQRIFEETWKTAKPTCNCGEPATVHCDDYEKKDVKSFCEKCFYLQDK